MALADGKVSIKETEEVGMQEWMYFVIPEDPPENDVL